MGSERGERPGGPRGLPFIGNTYRFAADPLSFYEELAREHGPVARYEVGGREFYQLSDPELVETVLVHENERFRKGETFEELLGPLLGDGLLLSEGEFWRQQRRQMQPSFGPDALAAYAPVMVEYTERLLSTWRDGEVRNVHADMMRLTVEIAAKALFDVDVREYEADIADALDVVLKRSEKRLERPIDVPDRVPTPGNRRYERALSTLNAVAEAIIAAHDPGGDTVVSRLLQAKTHVEGVDDEQIRNEVLTLLIAGHETTALALSYTCFLLASNPTQAERLRVELDAALDDDAPTLSTLDDLAYTKRVVREAMRLYPPVPALSREVAEPVTLGGYEFRPGETVSMQQWVLHRDPRYYDAPTAFRPARWDDDLQASLPRFAYFPFGGGPRRCIGDTFARQEAHLAVATIARDWTFDAVTDTLSFDPMLTLRPDGPVKLRVHQR